MENVVSGPRVRYLLGAVTFFLGFVAIVFSLCVGVAGLILHFTRGDIFWIGNPGAGPGVVFMLILEGFLLELIPMICTTFLGYCVQKTMDPTLGILYSSKLAYSAKRRYAHQSYEWDDLDSFVPDYKNPKGKPKRDWGFHWFKEHFAVKSPKWLWITLLIMAGTNMGLALTCFVLAGGVGAKGMGTAMRLYVSDLGAREAVDWVQRSGECCGDRMYSEWLSLQWCMEKSDLALLGMPSEFVYICTDRHRNVKYDVPPSCCTPPRGPCIHDPLDLLGLGPLHTEGCSNYIEDMLDSKYRGIAWFHVFFCGYKLVLVMFVMLLRIEDDRPSEKATDEEAKHLLTNKKPPKVSARNRPASMESIEDEPSPGRSKINFAAFKEMTPFRRLSKMHATMKSKMSKNNKTKGDSSGEEAGQELPERAMSETVEDGQAKPKKTPFVSASSPVMMRREYEGGRRSRESVLSNEVKSPVMASPTRNRVSDDLNTSNAPLDVAQITPSKHEQHRLSATSIHTDH